MPRLAQSASTTFLSSPHTTTDALKLRNAVTRITPNSTSILPVSSPDASSRLKLVSVDSSARTTPRVRRAPTQTNSFSHLRHNGTGTAAGNGGGLLSVQAVEAAASLVVGHSFDSPPTLPDRAPESLPKASPTQRQLFRAAEGGKNDLLPLATEKNSNHNPHHDDDDENDDAYVPTVPEIQPLRSRARSSSSTSIGRSYSGYRSADTAPTAGVRSLRSRKRSNLVDHHHQKNRLLLRNHHQLGRRGRDELSKFREVETTVEAPAVDQSFAGTTNGASHHCNTNGNNNSLHHHHGSNGVSLSSMGAPSWELDVNGKTRRRGEVAFLRLLQNLQHTWSRIKSPQWVMIILLLMITFYVAGSYQKISLATEQLEDVKMDEERLLLHLHKVEEHAVLLSQSLKRLNDRHQGAVEMARRGGGHLSEMDSVRQVDSDILRVQIEKMRDMEAELDHEVRELQKKIQQAARNSIKRAYGEGSVQIFFEIDSEEPGSLDGNGHPKNSIVMRLFTDTPHSAWTLLQQIQVGKWDGSTFAFDQGRALAAETPAATSATGPTLDFVESVDRAHERYTIGLTDTQILINLQNNRKLYPHEACVGKIIDGFDVLHKLVGATQQYRENKGDPVKIIKVTAAHMTRAESASLI